MSTTPNRRDTRARYPVSTLSEKQRRLLAGARFCALPDALRQSIRTRELSASATLLFQDLYSLAVTQYYRGGLALRLSRARIAEYTQMPISTVSRLLLQLESRRLIQRIQTRHPTDPYKQGWSIIELTLPRDTWDRLASDQYRDTGGPLSDSGSDATRHGLRSCKNTHDVGARTGCAQGAPTSDKIERNPPRLTRIRPLCSCKNTSTPNLVRRITLPFSCENTPHQHIASKHAPILGVSQGTLEDIHSSHTEDTSRTVSHINIAHRLQPIESDTLNDIQMDTRSTACSCKNTRVNDHKGESPSTHHETANSVSLRGDGRLGNRASCSCKNTRLGDAHPTLQPRPQSQWTAESCVQPSLSHAGDSDSRPDRTTRTATSDDRQPANPRDTALTECTLNCSCKNSPYAGLSADAIRTHWRRSDDAATALMHSPSQCRAISELAARASLNAHESPRDQFHRLRETMLANRAQLPASLDIEHFAKSVVKRLTAAPAGKKGRPHVSESRIALPAATVSRIQARVGQAEIPDERGCAGELIHQIGWSIAVGSLRQYRDTPEKGINIACKLLRSGRWQTPYGFSTQRCTMEPSGALSCAPCH